MMQKITHILHRTALIFVATLIVAAHPAAIASADALTGSTGSSGAPTQSSQQTPTSETASSAAPADTTGTDSGSSAASTSQNQLTDTTPNPAPNNDVTLTTTPLSSPTPSDPPTSTSTDIKNTTINTAEIDTKLDSSAQSGNAIVSNNDRAGNATSGNASAISTTVNMLQSTGGFDGNDGYATFTRDIEGTQYGDILLDPSLLTNLQVNSSHNTVGHLAVASQTTTAINNEITLDAQSGNAIVSNNDRAGNATSGNASAVANIVNIVNSVVGATKAFIGTININGNLDGDILLPESMKNLLTGSAQDPGTQSTVNNNSKATITNDITTTATSGDASVTGNDRAGNATTGNANTNVTLLNLTDHEIVGQNSIVVFINVLGKWVGFIVDAPQGATSGVLGSDITSNPGASNTTVLNSSDITITNKVNVSATSGNALVEKNDRAGNATSGDASASASIFNMANSRLSLGGWFGVLFINVFGAWHGSFGVDTEAGGFSTASAPTPQSGGEISQNPPAQPTVAVSSAVNTHLHSAVEGAMRGIASQDESGTNSGNANDSTKHNGVLGASSTHPQPPSLRTNSNHWVLPAVGLGCSLLLFAGEALRLRQRGQKVIPGPAGATIN